LETEKFKLKDLLLGLVVPLIVGLIIVAFPAILRPALDGFFPPPNMATGSAGSDLAFITVIFTHGFSLMVVFAIPLLLGMIWNKWAGGAAGFIMGTLYYIAFAGYNMAENTKNFLPYVIADPSLAKTYLPNLYADPSFIGNYIVCGILIGYIAGSLNNGSYNFKRMLGAGLTASILVGILQFVFNYTVSFGAWMTQGNPGDALFKTMLPLIILGVLGPIIAKVMTWYGLSPKGH
jgi:hypothetical protein